MRRNDTSAWLGAIGLERLIENPTPAYLADIGRQLLRAPAVMRPNALCTHLGNGTATSALAAILRTDMEITDTARYSRWRQGKFGYEPARRINASQPLFTPDMAAASDHAVVDDLIGEDSLLYEKIMMRLAASNGLSIHGRAFG